MSYKNPMKNKLASLMLILVLVTAACRLPISTTTPEPTPKAVAQLIIAADPGSTATPTPFLPIGPTPTLKPTEVVITPEAPAQQNTTQSTPVTVRQTQAEGTINILVMGSDYRPTSGFRTDVMILVSIHTKEATVSAVSFPRDLYVPIPGWMEQRLNTAFPHGGFSLMAETLQYNFGVRPDYYFVTNFQGFTSLVNSLNGIDVNAASQLSDTCDLPQSVNGYCSVNPGTNHMDGATALWYVRSRHSSSDFDRTRRAQEVMLALFSRLMSFDAVAKMPTLYETYRQTIETNMSVEDIAPLLPVATTVFNDTSRIRRYAISAAHVYPYVTSSGAQVLLPNYGAITQIIQEAVYTP